MKTIPVRFHEFQYTYPAREEPAWKARVERWYQLDAFAYGLTQAYTVWKPKLARPPAILVLASPQASNETDLAFVRSGVSDAAAFSPAKFVHTLPNIRCSPLCQVMDWAGPVICLQRDPQTFVHALREATALLENAPVWVMGAYRLDGRLEPARYRAELFVLGEPGPADFEIGDSRLNYKVALQTDAQLQEWLGSKDPGSSRGISLGDHCELRRARVGNESDSDFSHR